jgi:hypothetical protein
MSPDKKLLQQKHRRVPTPQESKIKEQKLRKGTANLRGRASGHKEKERRKPINSHQSTRTEAWVALLCIVIKGGFLQEHILTQLSSINPFLYISFKFQNPFLHLCPEMRLSTGFSRHLLSVLAPSLRASVSFRPLIELFCFWEMGMNVANHPQTGVNAVKFACFIFEFCL